MSYNDEAARNYAELHAALRKAVQPDPPEAERRVLTEGEAVRLLELIGDARSTARRVELAATTERRDAAFRDDTAAFKALVDWVWQHAETV